MRKVAIYVCGGLGNQLFQFACLIAYCKKHNYKAVFDRRHHGELHTKDLFWDQFPPLKERIENATLNVPYNQFQENDAQYQEIPSFSENERDILLRGYFNNEKYFVEAKDDILTLFNACFPSPPPTSTIGIHVRRGDYLKYNQVFFTLNKEYYQNALSLINNKNNENNNVTIVSEDTQWVKTHLIPYLPLNLRVNPYLHLPLEYEVKNGTILEDFQFLRGCETLILANSTFSWWAAYLSPRNPTVIFPLEWFKQPNLRNLYKYTVKGWLGASFFVPQEVHISNLLEAYAKARNWEAYLALEQSCPYVSSPQKEGIQLFKNPSKKLIEEVHSKYKDRVTSLPSFLRQNLTLLSPPTTISLDSIPVYIITSGGKRQEEMKKRFEGKGMKPIFIEGVKREKKEEGCSLAHQKALEIALNEGKFPFAIFEDDIGFTPIFHSTFQIPALTDALYLGMSRYGMGDWCQNGVRLRIEITEDCFLNKNPPPLQQFYKITNMLSAHAILYVTEKYAREALNLIGAAIKMKYINDIAQARLQAYGNVLCFKEPMCLQDICFASTPGQVNNNRETYVSVKEWKVIPAPKELYLKLP